MMEEQLSLRLPRTGPREQVRVAPERVEPLVWVRRVRVVDALDPDPKHVVRDIELRRGLNIVWSAPVAPGDQNQLFRNGIASHTAGKTTLCRLIRHLLGEASLAAEETRRRIRARFADGWLLGEVVIDSRPWAVARPLGVGPHPFCVPGASLDSVFHDGEGRVEYQRLLEAVEEATTSKLPAREFPGRDGLVSWDHLLPWLARDQECRFADLLEWRHPSSGSSAAGLHVDERQFVVRSVMALLTDAEREEQAVNARLVLDKQSAERREPLLRHQASVDHDRAEAELGVPLELPSHALFRTRAEEEIEKRRAALTRRRAALSAADRSRELQSALEHAVAMETMAQMRLERARQHVALANSQLEQSVERIEEPSAEDALFSELPPADGFCEVPMEIARAKGCPLAKTRAIQLDERRARKATEDEVSALRQALKGLEAEAERLKSSVDAAKAVVQGARTELWRASTTHQEQLAPLMEEEAALKQTERLVDRAHQAAREAEKLANQVVSLDQAIKKSYQKQDELRQATASALRQFSARFDYVMRAFVGDDVHASIEASGRSLKLVADEHGVRDSAAFETMKLLAFDLAALTESIEGRGHHPRFLIHDGPREADLDQEIYERLFLYARELEDCYEGEPGFQYIVTTTTPPPPDLQRKPWVRVELRGAPAQDRLLGRDL